VLPLKSAVHAASYAILRFTLVLKQ